MTFMRLGDTVAVMQVPPNSRLRVGDIVRLTGLSATSVRKLIDEGVLPSVRTDGGHRLVLASSVEAYLAQRDRVAS